MRQNSLIRVGPRRTLKVSALTHPWNVGASLHCSLPRKLHRWQAQWATRTPSSNPAPVVDGRYHAFAFRKYAKRYLAEATWRFNRRLGLADIASDLIESLTSMAPCPERELRRRVAA
jgi:hypothetical protein